MALTKRHPSEARPNGRSAPKGKVTGKMPSRGGHPVGEHGRSAPKAKASRVTSKSNSSPHRGGRGRSSFNAPNLGKAGAY